MNTLETAPAATSPPAKRTARWPWWMRWVLLGLFVVAIALAYVLLPLKEWLTAVADALQRMGPLAILLYVATYTVACLFALPAALLSIGAGAAFTTLGGFAVAVPAATIAASAAFLIARNLFSGRFRAWLLGKPRLSAVERAVNQKGAALVFLLRLSPLLPFPILNYVFGLTRIPYGKFALATFVGMMPITFLWCYVGEVGKALGKENAELGTAEIVFGVIGGCITLGVSIWVGRAAKKALSEATSD